MIGPLLRIPQEGKRLLVAYGTPQRGNDVLLDVIREIASGDRGGFDASWKVFHSTRTIEHRDTGGLIFVVELSTIHHESKLYGREYQGVVCTERVPQRLRDIAHRRVRP